MSKIMELHLKGKVPFLLPPLFIIWLMALIYQKKTQIMEVILRTAQSCPANQYVTIYYCLTQVIINQKYNIVEAAKNAIIEIEKDNKLKESLGNKE